MSTQEIGRFGLEVVHDAEAARNGRVRGLLWLARKGGPLKVASLTNGPIARSVVALERAALCARVAADHKADDILILDMRGLTPLYDFFVLATGSSRRQLHNLAEGIDAALRELGEQRLGIEGYEASRWIVQDYGDIVVHIFDPDARRFYALEDLWADAPRIDWERI
ncbi:MAG: ribosome silencing factor [Gemmataceae bacterium]|nr:ribosome silencing factor [Gemmataceae bacterium]MDW8264222.1 ribosome silencing factor [Gemmataceae bacterium]